MTTTAHTPPIRSTPRRVLLDLMPVPGRIVRSRRGRHTLLLLSGDFDIFTAGVISEAVSALLRRRAGLTSMYVDFDLRGVSFMDSRGLTALTEGARTLLDAGHEACVSRPGRHLRRLLTIAVTDGWLPAALTTPETFHVAPVAA